MAGLLGRPASNFRQAQFATTSHLTSRHREDVVPPGCCSGRTSTIPVCPPSLAPIATLLQRREPLSWSATGPFLAPTVCMLEGAGVCRANASTLTTLNMPVRHTTHAPTASLQQPTATGLAALPCTVVRVCCAYPLCRLYLGTLCIAVTLAMALALNLPPFRTNLVPLSIDTDPACNSSLLTCFHSQLAALGSVTSRQAIVDPLPPTAWHDLCFPPYLMALLTSGSAGSSCHLTYVSAHPSLLSGVTRETLWDA